MGFSPFRWDDDAHQQHRLALRRERELVLRTMRRGQGLCITCGMAAGVNPRTGTCYQRCQRHRDKAAAWNRAVWRARREAGE